MIRSKHFGRSVLVVLCFALLVVYMNTKPINLFVNNGRQNVVFSMRLYTSKIDVIRVVCTTGFISDDDTIPVDLNLLFTQDSTTRNKDTIKDDMFIVEKSS